MKTTRFTCLTVFSALLLAVSNVQAEKETTRSPRGTFEIVQVSRKDRKDNYYYWSESLHFRKAPARTILLEQQISWRAFFEISPDERWMLRRQKTGSGENVGILYRIEANGRVSRVEETLNDLAIAYLKKKHRFNEKDYFHVGIVFTSWDLKKSALNFEFHASPDNNRDNPIDIHLTYHLDTHTVTAAPAP